MIQRAGALEVLMLDGWCRSVGVNAEIDFARGLGLPIEFREFVVKSQLAGAQDA
jgi:hypothetical protein